MRENRDPDRPDPAEQPTQAAQLTIRADPARVKITARRWVTAEGTVPPDEAQHLISTIGIVGCVVTGATAAVLTLRIAPGLTELALAELLLALVGMLLIAVRSKSRAADQVISDNRRGAGRKDRVAATQAPGNCKCSEVARPPLRTP